MNPTSKPYWVVFRDPFQLPTHCCSAKQKTLLAHVAV
jgi:hypothetical protein